MDTCASNVYEVNNSTGNNECKSGCDTGYESEVDSEYEDMRKCVRSCDHVILDLGTVQKCVDECPSQLNGNLYALNQTS